KEAERTFKGYIWPQILVMLGWRAFFTNQISYIPTIFHHPFTFNHTNLQTPKPKTLPSSTL
ncbi:hypothetical protein, partial [Bacillus sp. WP8]|uniref:hypothetical protein n=1 Tax=Bacillus sp. WP8 TaxID=756828 RepID=UPI001C92EA9E